MKCNLLLALTTAGVASLALATATGGCGGSSHHNEAFVTSGSATQILLITGESPPTGPITGGTTITLTGTGFQNGIAVLVANLPATDVTVVSDTTLTAVAPAGFQGASDITAYYPATGQGFVLPAGFTYLTLPQIYSISPAAVPTAASGLKLAFVLSGAGFEPGLTTVSFGTTPATNVVVQSPNFLTGTIPTASAASTVTITITSGGVANTVPMNEPPVSFTYQ